MGHFGEIENKFYLWKIEVENLVTHSSYTVNLHHGVGGSQQEQEEPPGEGLPQVPGGGQHLQGLHAHGRGKSWIHTILQIDLVQNS